MLNRMPGRIFTSDQKSHNNSISTLDQFISFSQNSGGVENTPFKKTDIVIEQNPYSRFSPMQASNGKKQVDKENFNSQKKSRSSTKKQQPKVLQSSIYVYQNQNNQRLQSPILDHRISKMSSQPIIHTQSGTSGQKSRIVDNQYLIQHKSQISNHGSSQVTFEVLNSHKKNIIAMSPHVKSISKSAQKAFRTEDKSRSTSQQKRFNKYSELKKGASNKKKSTNGGYESRGSSSLLYNEDYMNDVFTNEDEDEVYGQQQKPVVHPFQLEQVNDEPYHEVNPDQNDALTNLNNDLNTVWGSS